MKVVKQINKYNQFNIENLTLGRLLGIIATLEFCEQNGLNTNATSKLLEALNNQQHKMKK